MNQLGILVGVVFEVGVLDEHDVAARFLDAAPDGGTFPLIHILQNVADLRPLLCERRDDVFRPVGRLVIDDNDLLVDRHLLDAAQQFGDCGAFVVAGNDDRQGRRLCFSHPRIVKG